MTHVELGLQFTGRPYVFSVGTRVKTRGDIGAITGFVVTHVWNDWFCQCRRIGERGKRYHFNMAFLEFEKRQHPKPKKI